MSTIHVLPPLLVNQIAAGECIERPASVVKELVENSIDAGATQVEILVEEAGTRLIRILDNGGGISAEDLPLALTSHATSKLTCVEDLLAINTLGFRGEALASIASVAEICISSCVPGDINGYSITSKGGETDTTKPVAMVPGTIIEVHDLFFNIPARRKFLKKRSTEMGYITDTIMRLALAAHNVSFKLMHNNRQVLNVQGTDDPKVRVEDLLNIKNVEVIPVIEEDTYKLRAYLAPPEVNRPNNKLQFVYLNGRSIKDRIILKALSDAYCDYLPARRHAVAVVHLDIPPEEVDVNVHPTKSEVRYRDSSRIYGTIYRSVLKSLSSYDLTPELPIPGNSYTKSSLQELPKNTNLPIPKSDEPPIVKENSTLYQPVKALDNTLQPLKPEISNTNTPLLPPETETSTIRIERSRNSEEIAADPSLQPLQTPTENTTTPTTTENLFSSYTPPPTLPRYFQVHDSYLVVETKAGIEIIDQHALHERIIFSQLREQVKSSKVISQMLLFPATLRLTGKEMGLFQQWQHYLAEVGIEAEQFGPNEIIIRSLPQLLKNVEGAELVQEILQQLEHRSQASLEEILEPVLAMMSCKAAIKFGDNLKQPEVESLLTRKADADNPYHCPHGRPTTLKISLEELEKHFKRR